MSLLERLRAMTPDERGTLAVGVLAGLFGLGAAYAAGRHGRSAAVAQARQDGYERGESMGRARALQAAANVVEDAVEMERERAAAFEAAKERGARDSGVRRYESSDTGEFESPDAWREAG